MLAFLATQAPVVRVLMGTLFPWFCTAAGAALVFLFKKLNRKALDGMLGTAAGIKIAASFFSLIAPAVELTEQAGLRD